MYSWLKEVLLVKMKKPIEKWDKSSMCRAGHVVWYQREGCPKVHCFVSDSCEGLGVVVSIGPSQVPALREHLRYPKFEVSLEPLTSG